MSTDPDRIAFAIRGYGIEDTGALQGWNNEAGTLVAFVDNQGVYHGPSTQTLLRRASIVLTDSQIRGLPDVPVEFIAAPGAQKLIVPVSGVLTSNIAVGGSYTSISSPSYIGLFYGAGGQPYRADANSTGLLVDEGGESVMLDFVPDIALTAGAGPAFDLPLSVSAVNALGVYGSGNPANTLTVTVYYTIEDFS